MDHDDLGSAADQRARPFALENNRPLLQYPEHDDPDDDSHLARLLYQYHNQPGSLSPASLRFAHHHLTTRGDPPPPPDVPARYHQGAIPTRADSHDFDAVSPDEHYYQSYHDFRYDISWDVPHMVDSPDPQPSVVHPDHGHSLPRRPVAMRNRSLPQNSSDNNARSPSSPAGASLNATAASPGRLQYGKPSVKDLKQRFDQSGQASSIPSPGGVPRRRRNGSDMSDASREVVHSYSALRSGAADQSVPGFGTSAKAPRSQRSRFVPEDQVSNNTQSFASRVGRPRNSNGANPNASPSVAQPPPPPTLAPSPSAHSSQGLLFGEILPDQYETSALGFGIESVRPRRVSESGAEPPSTNLHQRSLSHPDAEPSSPADWYRHVDTTLDPVGADAASDARWHGRSLSDASAQKQHASIPSTTRKATNRNTNLSPSANQASPSSRLPLSVRRLNGPADSSPGPTRSNSPTTLRRQPVTGRGSRATTPTSRAKTPVQGRIPRKAAPEPPNARLEAYIAAPPPKLSPPLRSSRPRQGVSTASTASSRMKMKAPAGPQARGRTPTATPETVRRRKISVGPIDFEQRREHIRLAYSKSLRESQALESRKRAAERRRQELEAAAREAEAKAATAEALDLHHDRASHSPSIPAGDPDAVLLKVEESEVLKAPTRDDLPIASSDFSTHDSAEPVVQPEPAISSMRPRQDHERAQEKPVPAHPTPTIITSNIESPDLGLPGSFPTSTPPLNVEEPPSAVSTTTVTTEFDLDPQRRSLLPPASPQEAPIVVNPPSPEIPASQPTHVRAEYHSPFDEDGDLLDRNEGLLAHRGDIEPSYGTDSESAYGKLHDDTSACVSVLEDDGECDDDPTESIPFPRLEMHDESECCSDLESVHGLTNVKGTSSREDTVANPYAADMDDQARSEDCVSESRFGDGHRASSCATESEAGDHQEEADCLGYQPAPASANLLIPPSTRPAPLNRTSQWTDITVSTPNLADLAKSPVFEGPGSPAYGHVTIFGSQVLSRDSDIARREVETRPQLVERESYNSGSYNSGRSSGYLEYQDPVKANDEAYYGDDLLAQPPSQGTAQNVPYVPSPNHDPPPVPVSPPNSSVDERMSGTFYEPNPYRRTLMDSTREIGEYMDRVQSPLAASANPFGENDRYSGTPSQRDSGLSSERIEGAELPEKERRRLIQRRNVLKELVDTEAVFVRDMNIVEEIYKGTAEACPKLDAKTVKQIFRNTDDIIAFHTAFLVQVKEAVASVYVPKSSRAAPARTEGAEGSESVEISDAKDREVALGTVFKTNIEQMKLAHEGFLRSSDQAAKSLIQIQQDPTVKVWLNECNEVAKELTAAWDLDSLLIKPMQRITKYPNLIITILQHTPGDHPDREALASAKDQLETAIVDINKTKKNFELVGQIVGRKRKESDVRNGFARAFGKRVDKLQVAGNRPPEDPEYAKLNEKFGDDYLRLQVVLRDVEFYTRQVSTYVREFLQYLSSVELVMRLQPGHYPEIESKWVQFNISIRDIEKVALEEHVSQPMYHFCPQTMRGMYLTFIFSTETAGSGPKASD